MSKPLSAKKIAAELAKLPGWTWEHDALAKTFEFADFRAALAFMVRAGFEAEELKGHTKRILKEDEVGRRELGHYGRFLWRHRCGGVRFRTH
jgi:pterin-4a-carbinolamine dehydratase